MSDGLAGLLSALQPVAEMPLDLEAIRAGGWADGFAAGEARAEAGLVPMRERMAAAVEGLEAACRVDVDRVRPVVLGLVRRLVEAVVQRELSLNDSVMDRLVESALEAVRPGEGAVLRGHPVTLAGLGVLAIATEADAGMALDAVVVTGADFVIEVGLSARLAEIMEEMS